MTSPTSSKTLVALVATGCLLVALEVSAQTQRPDELRFNGNNGDQASNGDTTIISDNTTPGGGNQQQFSDDDANQQPFDDQQRPPFSPLEMLFGPMPSFGMDQGNSPFGGGPPRRRPFSMLQQLLGGGGSFLEPIRHFDRTFERQFRDLERKASAGEGQDVSYFQRNGVAYVRTCTTKRVTPQGGEQDQKQLPGPLDSRPDNLGLDLNQQQQQQQPQQQPAGPLAPAQQQGQLRPTEPQGFSHEIPSIPSSTASPRV